jgi:FKBP-type peptidyl-prolyl cis-trans isomerase SlpA|tara:strand:- start:132 stop:545 length:414 start_codon:yes stop_codon:yes gene_type:complete
MIKEGSKVKVHYTGKFEDNQVFDTSKDKEPLEFTLGEGQLIPGFENGLVGLTTGDKKTVELEPEQAYGPIRDELINDVPMDKLPEGVKQGQMLQAKTEQGEMNVVVTEIKETTATVDANHPLAGKKLIFDLEVVEVM